MPCQTKKSIHGTRAYRTCREQPRALLDALHSLPTCSPPARRMPATCNRAGATHDPVSSARVQVQRGQHVRARCVSHVCDSLPMCGRVWNRVRARGGHGGTWPATPHRWPLYRSVMKFWRGLRAGALTRIIEDRTVGARAEQAANMRQRVRTWSSPAPPRTHTPPSVKPQALQKAVQAGSL